MPDIADPSTFLPTPKVLVIKQITKSTLDSIGTNQTSFSKVGILKNITTTDSVNPLPNTQPNQAITGRMTTKIRLNPNIGAIALPITINPGKVFVDTNTPTAVISADETIAISNDYESNVVSIKEVYDEETGDLIGTDLEIAGVDELLFDEITTATSITIDGVNYVVDTTSLPDYKINTIDYVTTKVLSSNIVFDTSTGSEPSTKISFLL